MKKTALRFGAATAATGLVMLGIAPAQAAEPVSQAEATAIKVGVAGNVNTIVDPMTATNDGTGEVTTGDPEPPISILDNQLLANVGVLTQQATARVAENGNGVSYACSGVAGEGGSVVAVGDSNCITPGQPVGVQLPNLDLSGVVAIDPESALGGLSALNPILDQVLSAVTAPLTDALAPLADTGIYGNLGAVEARCVANPGVAQGNAVVTDAGLRLNVAGTDVPLVTLPTNPAPNTEVLVQIDDVVGIVLDGLQVELETALDGVTDPLNLLVGTLRQQVLDALLTQVNDALLPLTEALQENVLKIVLNEQVVSEGGAKIDVTALRLEVLPAAAQFVDGPLVGLEIGQVSCGPNSVYVAPTPTPTDPPTTPDTPDEEPPAPPTKVTSGVESAPGDAGLGLLGGLLALGTAAGIVGFRRSLKA